MILVQVACVRTSLNMASAPGRAGSTRDCHRARTVAAIFGTGTPADTGFQAAETNTIVIVGDKQIPEKSGSGTVFIRWVGPRTVLTASHVVSWNANPAIIEFVPAYFNGVSTVDPDVSSFVNSASAYDLGSPPAAAFAILRLLDRLGDSLGWFGKTAPIGRYLRRRGCCGFCR